MSNTNTSTTYTSSTGLSTAKVTTFFRANDVPSFGTVAATSVIDFAAETLLNPAGTAVRVNYPVFSVAADSFAPVTVICECIKALSQAGTSSSTTLTQSLSVATTPATVAITTGTTPTIINATGTTRGTTLAGTVASAGTTTLAAGQFQTDPINLTSSTAMVVKPGQTLYVSFLPSGTLTTDTNYTGTYKYYIVGNTMTTSTLTP